MRQNITFKILILIITGIFVFSCSQGSGENEIKKQSTKDSSLTKTDSTVKQDPGKVDPVNPDINLIPVEVTTIKTGDISDFILLSSNLETEVMADVFKGAVRPRTTSLMWEWRFHVYGHCINRSPILAIRRENWKLLLNPGRDRIELYDIPNDPMELNNKADAHPATVRDLGAEVLRWQTSLPEGPMDPDAGSNAYPWPGTF